MACERRAALALFNPNLTCWARLAGSQPLAQISLARSRLGARRIGVERQRAEMVARGDGREHDGEAWSCAVTSLSGAPPSSPLAPPLARTPPTPLEAVFDGDDEGAWARGRTSCRA